MSMLSAKHHRNLPPTMGTYTLKWTKKNTEWNGMTWSIARGKLTNRNENIDQIEGTSKNLQKSILSCRTFLGDVFTRGIKVTWKPRSVA
jgi:hypothetical protein